MRRKDTYKVEKLLPALRLAVEHRKQMLDHITDNAGAIHAIERILGILCADIQYPGLTHISGYKRRADAEISRAAHAARKRGDTARLHIEHVMPQRAFAKAICALIDGGASDAKVLRYIRRHYRLVVLTAEERAEVDRINRTRITEDRIADAGITLYQPRRAA